MSHDTENPLLSASSAVANSIVAIITSVDITGLLGKSRRKVHVVISIDDSNLWTSATIKKDSYPRFLAEGTSVRRPIRPSSVLHTKIYRERRAPLDQLGFGPHLLDETSHRVIDLLDKDQPTPLNIPGSPNAALTIRLKLDDSPALSKVQLDLDRASEMLDRAQATIAMRLDSRVLAASSNVVDQGLSAATTAQSAYQRVQSFSDMVWVGAALKSVDVLVKFVDGITDAHPAFKLGWTILSYVYKALKEQQTRDDQIRVLAADLAKMLGWARECSDLKTIDGTEDVIVTIGQLVVEGGVLIDECMGHGFDVRAVSGALGDVGDRIQQCRQKMDEARQDLSMTLEILILRNVQNSITQGASKLQHEEKEANEKIVRKFMKHLEPVDVAKVRSDLKKAVLSDSGAWFLNMNVVQGWMSVGGHGNLDLDADGATVVSPSNSMLWCYGKPGSGKTILATVLVEEISKKYTDRAIISTTYFPLKFDIPSRRTTSSVANTVLHQLLTQLPDEERLELAKTINDSNILSLILSVTSKFKHCFLVLDALDECDDLGDLLDLIGKLRNSFRILIFSRDYRDIRTFLKRIGLDTEIGLDTLSSSSVERKSEIRIFVQAKLQEYQERQKLVIGDPSVVVEVMDALTDNAYGMWLWVVLQIETLCLQRTDSDIRAAIKDLPKDLDTTYLRALRRVEELGSRTSRKVQRALKWIVGAHRPLTVEEFAQAVAIAEVDSDDEPWVTYSKINDPRALVDDCANLCMVSLDWEGKSVVQFIHASVRDYLLASPSNFKESLPKYHIASLPDLHYELATSCVSYLKLVRYRDSRRTSVALFTSTGDVTGTISTFRYVTEQSGENLKKHLRMYLPVLLSSRPSIYDREIIDAMVRAYALAIDNASGLIPAEAVFSSSRLALTMEPPGHHLRHILLQNLAVTIHQLGPMEEKINCQSFHAAELIYQHILGQRPQELSCMEGLADIATDRFNFTGDVTFLDKSTKLLDDVLKLCHVDNYAQRSRVLDKLANTARDRSILGLSASGLTDTVHMYAEALRSAIDQNTRASCLADFTDTLIALSCFSDASLEEAVLTIREAMTGISFDEFRDFDRLVELFFKAASKETHPGYPISYTMTEVFLGRRRTYHNCALAALCLCHGSTDSHADIRLRVTHGRRLFMELQSMILSSQSQLGTDSTDGLQDKEYRYIGSGISVPMRQLRQRLDAAQHLYVVGLGVAMHTIAQGDTNLSLAILEASENPEWSDTTCLGALFSKTLPKVSLDVITSMANSKTSESDAARLQTLVQQIQALGVYEALLASTLSSLVQTAQHGHLVVLFRGESTCHAVLMRKGSQDISDPLLLGQSAYDSMAAWSRPEHDNQRDVIRLMPKYPDGKGTHISDQWALDALHNLWLHVVEPIFIFLKLSKSSGANRPRLFWRTAGFDHYIPLHAAGLFKAPDGQEIPTCSDYVVSSYVPSFSTISQTLTKAPRLLHPDGLKILLVARKTFQDWKVYSVPSTTTEVRAVFDILAPQCSVLLDTDLTELSAEDALGSLSRINCFHIACHSWDNHRLNSPAEHYNPLTLAKTIKSELPAAAFAFVSMCGSTPAYLSNEGRPPHNMTSYAFKMGFRSLVTVQWEMRDDDGPEIATNFYRYLTEKASGGIHLDDVPYALDGAIQALRACGAEPWRWLPFIHIGY